jgi:hypothetical protein
MPIPPPPRLMNSIGMERVSVISPAIEEDPGRLDKIVRIQFV